MTDWSPGAYGRFRGIRLRPALDLMARVPDLPPGAVVDLGCGAGAAAEALAVRFPGRSLVGVDSSPAMLAEARARGLYAALEAADAAIWRPVAPPALIFSNAALHWVADHGALLPRLASLLPPGGVLAVQMPRQHDAPSHRLIRSLAGEVLAGRFDPANWRPPVAPAADYVRLLAPLGAVDAWETEYVHRLPPDAEGHPVRRFTEATAMRPYLAGLSAEESARYVAAYDAALASAYPPERDGSVLFPFRRLFLVFSRPAE